MLAAGVAYYALNKANNRIEAQILDHKTVRETTATVTAKQHVRFDEVNHSYLKEDGSRVERQPGYEEWRIYYQIDNCDQIEEPVRSHLRAAEMERVTKGRQRFTIVAKGQYDRIEVGEKLNVGWQWLGNDKVEIVTAGKPFH